MNGAAINGVHGQSYEAWHRHLGRNKALRPRALRRTLTIGTLASAAERSLAARAMKPLLSVDRDVATGADLLKGSDAVVDVLRASCSIHGRRVLLSMPNSIDFAIAYLGVLRAGCSAVVTNPALTRPELERLIAAGEVVAALVSPAVADTLALSGPAYRIGASSQLIVLETDLTPAGAQAPPTPRPSDEAVLAHTSGSTGEPKGVPLSHANLLASMRAAMTSWRWSPDDVVLHSLPLYHQHGLGSIHALFLGGGRTTILSHFDPEQLASRVQSEQATVLLGVPATYRRLLEADPGREQFASLRLAVSGSAPLPPAMFAEIAAVLGLPPLERYGMTESGLDISNLYEGPRSPGSVGYPLPGVEAVVVDSDGETELPAGSDGEILLRGPQVFSGYLGGWDPDAISSEGWLHTGDIGRVDPHDGSISITGRLKDVIISGGLNIYPREVEVVLERHPDVAAVAVGGVISERWGEVVCAMVVPRPGTRPRRDDLVAMCDTTLARYKHPKYFFLVPELPRNDMGKVLRSALAPLAESGVPLD